MYRTRGSLLYKNVRAVRLIGHEQIQHGKNHTFLWEEENQHENDPHFFDLELRMSPSCKLKLREEKC